MIGLWVIMLIWISFVVYRASVELRNNQVVRGLFRDYHPPYKRADGWVIDPSQRNLAEELGRRLGNRSLKPAPNNATPEAWLAWLRQEGIDARLHSGTAPQSPHLRFTKGALAPELWIGRYGVDFIVFVDRVGVMQRSALSKPTTVIELLGLQVTPW